jgi:hypothetical protein
LRLRLLLLLIGDLKLIGQLLAKPRNQKLGGQCRITELDLFDDDSRPQPFGTQRRQVKVISTQGQRGARSRS